MNTHSQSLLFFLIVALICAASCKRPSKVQSHGDIQYARAEAAVDEGDMNKVSQLLREAVDAYQSENNEDGMAKALLALSQVCTSEMLIDSALSYIDRALALNVENDSLRAALLGQKGSTNTQKGDFKESVRYYRMAMDMGEEAFYGEDKAVGCGNAAISCRRLGMADSARFFLEEGISAAKKVDDYEDLAFLYNNLAVFFIDLGRYNEGKEACENAYEAALKAENNEEALSAKSNEGGLLMKKGENQKAISLLEEILPNIESEGSANLYLKTVNYLLITSLKMDDEARINKYLAKGEKIASNMHNMGVVAMSLMSAMIDAKIRKGDYSDALQTLEQVDTATLVNGLYPRDLYLKHKANCMSGLGDYRQAYLLQCEADSFSEKIRGIEAQKQLSELYGKLKVQEREVKIARLSKEVAQRQLLIVIFATGFVILALLGIAYFFWRRRREEQLQAQRYVEGLERERARFARELHDGACNELLGIGMTINTRMAEPDEVANRIRQLRDTLRNISHELMPPQFDKATLDDILGYYLQHIKSPNLDVQFSAQGDFSKLPKQVAYEFYRIVQETLGNTISHASATLAKVEIKCDSNEVTMSVSDNGHVVADGNGEGRRGNSPTGIGLQSIKDRVKSINADLNVEVGEQGTVVSIKKLL